MKKNILICLVLYLFCLPLISNAQVKAMYVDLFGNHILGDAALEANLISFAHDNGFNYLILYDVGGNVLSRDNPETALTNNQISLSTFIQTAKDAITDLQIGVSEGVFKTNSSTVQSIFFDNVVWYNTAVNDVDKAIDVMHLEYEYWHNTWQLNKLDFNNNYLLQLGHMRNLANASSNPVLLVETYLGEMNTTIDPGDPENHNG